MAISFVESADVLPETVCQACRGTGTRPPSEEGNGPPCHDCEGDGMIMTRFGARVVSVVRRYLLERRVCSRPSWQTARGSSEAGACRSSLFWKAAFRTAGRNSSRVRARVGPRRRWD
jgi:hypothetical protein